jgi:phosphotransferase system enzyme I (PtsI)
MMMRSSVLGFVTEVGGKTSHTAIMARSLELPAVVAVNGLTDQIGTGDVIIIDGSAGMVIINPSPEEVRQYQGLQTRFSHRRAELDRARMEPATTNDGVPISVLGNIELLEETKIVLEHGAEGVGLYRTEYLFMNRAGMPDEQEQYEHFRSVLEDASPNSATIRTLDLGGDKLAGPLRTSGEANPVMGLRALRLCLKEVKLFRTHLRALLRASAHGNLKLMVPLVSSIEEIREVREIIESCRLELMEAGEPMAEHVPFGIMIEVPAAALMADQMAREVDFFSIGTNDLVQYTLAVDRSNQYVAHLYRPLHPAMLRLLSEVVNAANIAGVEVSMCGEMAGDPLCVPVLLGMGLRSLSMNPTSIPLVKAQIRALNMSDCQTLYQEVRSLDTVDAIDLHVRTRLHHLLDGKLAPEVLDSYLDSAPSANPIADRATIESFPPGGFDES